MATRRAGTKSAPIDEVLVRLHRTYPEAACSLTHETPLELLIATILSAQCTDARVNMVTPTLFRRFPTVQALADAPAGSLEDVIKSTGFFNAKARSIRAAPQLPSPRRGSTGPSR